MGHNRILPCGWIRRARRVLVAQSGGSPELTRLVARTSRPAVTAQSQTLSAFTTSQSSLFSLALSLFHRLNISRQRGQLRFVVEANLAGIASASGFATTAHSTSSTPGLAAPCLLSLFALLSLLLLLGLATLVGPLLLGRALVFLALCLPVAPLFRTSTTAFFSGAHRLARASALSGTTRLGATIARRRLGWTAL